MCSALGSQGGKVELILPRGQAFQLSALGCRGSIWQFYGLTENFSIRYLPNPFSRFGNALRKPGYAFFAMSYVMATGKQVVNVRQIELAMMAARFNRPFVFECHNFFKPSSSKLFPRFIEIMNSPRCRGGIVSTTQAGRNSFVKAGVPEGRIAVLPNGVHIHRYEELPPQEDLRRTLQLPGSKAIACFSGSLYPGRGIENIIYCAERFKDIYFLIIGGSPDEVRHYRGMAAKSDSKNMHFTGHVPSTNVPHYLKAADLLLMPNTSKSSGHSIVYASPMKVFDYLAAGKPIIASDFPVLREIFTHEQNAFLVPADSEQELARGLQWVLDNPAKAGKMAEQACCDAAGYSWKKRAAEYLSFVQAL